MFESIRARVGEVRWLMNHSERYPDLNRRSFAGMLVFTAFGWVTPSLTRRRVRRMSCPGGACAADGTCHEGHGCESSWGDCDDIPIPDWPDPSDLACWCETAEGNIVCDCYCEGIYTGYCECTGLNSECES